MKTTSDPRLPRGFMYRRWKGTHKNVDKGPPGTIYWEHEEGGIRSQHCLHTENVDSAVRIIRELDGKVQWGEKEKRLKSLVKIGLAAKMELDRLMFGG